MSFVHVYKVREARKHALNGGADCVCEPRIINLGVDSGGFPARIFVHNEMVIPKEFMGWLSSKSKTSEGGLYEISVDSESGTFKHRVRKQKGLPGQG